MLHDIPSAINAKIIKKMDFYAAVKLVTACQGTKQLVEDNFKASISGKVFDFWGLVSLRNVIYKIDELKQKLIIIDSATSELASNLQAWRENQLIVSNNIIRMNEIRDQIAGYEKSLK